MKKLIIYLFFLANLLAIIWLWWPQNSSFLRSSDLNLAMIALGRLGGLFAVFFVLCQIMLIGRVKWAALYHVNGFFILFFIFIHPILLVLGYAGSRGINLMTQFFDFLNNYQDVGKAVFALMLFLTAGASLVVVKRKFRFETWHFAHLLAYAAILFAFGHQLTAGADFQNNPAFVSYWYALYTFAVGNFVYFRVVRPLYVAGQVVRKKSETNVSRT